MDEERQMKSVAGPVGAEPVGVAGSTLAQLLHQGR